MIRPSRIACHVTLALCPALLLLMGCARKGEEEGGGDKEVKAVVAAKTAVASVEPFTHTISAIGSVVARPDRYAALSAPAPTRIARVHVAAGQRVAAGAPLVEFERVTFNAEASGAQAKLTAAQRAYERAARLANEGIVPRKDVEQAAADLGAARAAAVTARRAQQLSVLRSPVSGVVTHMSAVLGAPADAGQVLVEVADPSAFDVVLMLGPTEAGAVRPGASVAHPLDDGPAVPHRVTRLSAGARSTWLSVTFAEGRYREVKRYCKALGHPVRRLKRVQFGPLRLGDLPPGAHRVLTNAERSALDSLRGG